MPRVCIALLHHPVRDRSGNTITTAITNLDLHDMSRSSRTYGLTAMYVVHPIQAQRALAERVREHWLHGSGAQRIPDRVEPMRILQITETLAEAIQAFGGDRQSIEIWTTSAQARTHLVAYPQARARLRDPNTKPVMIVFGTGWGLANEVEDMADLHLQPIESEAASGFNHLSVRAACAISLDRLLGKIDP